MNETAERPKILSDKGVKLVEEFLSDCERFRVSLGTPSRDGKAEQIQMIVATLENEIMDIVEE